MLKRIFVLTLVLIAFPNFCNAQNNAHFKDINKVWAKFYKAFETLNYELMAEIHAEDLVRISGGRRILNYDTYINNYKKTFENYRASGNSYTISLRFFERLHNSTMSSERGIYKLTVNKNQPNAQSYYGQFHVIMKNINGEWKITMDYDSNEGNTIGQKDYDKAFAIDDLDRF